MALDIERLLHWREPPLRQAYDAAHTMRYALGIGLGYDPADAMALRHVFERTLVALPTLATVLAARFGWLYRTDAGVTPSQCVHVGQTLRMHGPLPPEGEVIGTLEVTGIEEKGKDRGALVFFRRELRDASSGQLLCTLDADMFCRADGAQRASYGHIPASHAPLPAREADLQIDTPTLPQQALLFRLSGDFNAIHADPGAARAAGFERPLLHGLSSYGAVAYALLRPFAEGDADRLVRIEARFARPVFPGELLRTEAWADEPGRVRFRTTVPQRSVTVLDQGLAEFLPRA
ncbi:MAG TPA: MaoC/PaaZ C-terminal domain-containing protein [Rubrivivax sp.]|nr:MaoC/PaaZ C-terminal domain-containing protein [Rubrivivax sp.]